MYFLEFLEAINGTRNYFIKSKVCNMGEIAGSPPLQSDKIPSLIVIFNCENFFAKYFIVQRCGF